MRGNVWLQSGSARLFKANPLTVLPQQCRFSLLITRSYSLQVRSGISIQSGGKHGVGGLVSLANRNVESFHYSWLFTVAAHKLKHSGWSEAAGLSSSETSQFRLQGQVDRWWNFLPGRGRKLGRSFEEPMSQ